MPEFVAEHYLPARGAEAEVARAAAASEAVERLTREAPSTRWLRSRRTSTARGGVGGRARGSCLGVGGRRHGRLLVVLAVAGLAVHAGSASAATFTAACSGHTGDPASLIAAINSANAAGGSNTVQFGAGCTYTLTAVDNNWYGPNGLPAIASDITIEGNGATIARAVSAPKFRFFFVGADLASASTDNYVSPGAGRLTLEDVTLSGGLAKGGTPIGGGGGAGMGGAIFSQGTVIIDDSTLTGNTAQGGASGNQGLGDGGGGIGTEPITWRDRRWVRRRQLRRRHRRRRRRRRAVAAVAPGSALRRTAARRTPARRAAGGGPLSGMGGSGGNGVRRSGGDGGGGGGGGGSWWHVGARPGGGGFGDGGHRRQVVAAAWAAAAERVRSEPGVAVAAAVSAAAAAAASRAAAAAASAAAVAVAALVAAVGPAVSARGSGRQRCSMPAGGGGAGMGGAIFNMQGQLTIANSTLAGNEAIAGADNVHGPRQRARRRGVQPERHVHARSTRRSPPTPPRTDGGSIYNLVYDAATGAHGADDAAGHDRRGRHGARWTSPPTSLTGVSGGANPGDRER